MRTDCDVSIADCDLHFIDVETRAPLKFGTEVTTRVTCARTKVTVAGADGAAAEGWGETPLSVAWVWPSGLSYAERDTALRELCRRIMRVLPRTGLSGHPMEIGRRFLREELPCLLAAFNAERGAAGAEAVPWLAALACFSLFDIAVHDAYAVRLRLPVYGTYNARFMNHDLAWYYGGEDAALFRGKHPEDFLVSPAPAVLPAWHLVGGKDLLTRDELTGGEPDDGYPVLLADWIRRDGLRCLKVKLTGVDSVWDFDRLARVGAIALANGAEHLCADFNCTVRDPRYVTDILDRLAAEQPRMYGMLLYVEQPFPYDLRANRIDVRSVSARKPLFMDESAHDWEHVALGRGLGWTGVALKTCKTQTGALLSACWAKAHGMALMVQDLTNPMLAQIPHLLLAAHAGTVMGVETNAMQFYPGASLPEAAAHPGMYLRRNGAVDLGTLGATGFGYRVDEIGRELPPRED